MSGLLHPVGPESAQIYWARRALVFGAAAVLAVAAALIISGTSSGSEAQPNQQAAAYPVGSPTASTGPAKLQASGDGQERGQGVPAAERARDVPGGEEICPVRGPPTVP